MAYNIYENKLRNNRIICKIPENHFFNWKLYLEDKSYADKVWLVGGDKMKITEEQQVPNAQLIAAAPELLETSKKLLKKFNNYEEVTGTIEEIRRIIVKVEGGN